MTLGDVILKGLASARPAAGIAGRLYFATDSGVISRDNGSTWDELSVGASLPPGGTTGQALVKASNDDGDVEWGDVGGTPLTPPVEGDFTWINQGTATASVVRNCLVLYHPSSAGDHCRVLSKAIPSAKFKVRVAAAITSTNDGPRQVGLLLRDSATGKLETFALSNWADYRTYKWNNPDTYSGSDYGYATPVMHPSPRWLQIEVTATQNIFSVSYDEGRSWAPLFTHGKADFLTADCCGIFINNPVGNACYGTFYHYEEEIVP